MEKLKFGDQYQENVRFTQKMSICLLMEDRNPIHIDEAYAAKHHLANLLCMDSLPDLCFQKCLE